jgi:diguanylate cyclase (GGDEF)-like protein
MSGISSFDMRVTRRMVALFILCALVPVVATIAVAYDRMHKTLVAQRSLALAAEAAGYSTSVIDRLSVAEHLSRALADDLDDGAAARMGLGVQFRSAVWYGKSGERALFGEPAYHPGRDEVSAVMARAGRDAPGLLIARGDREAGVWLVRSDAQHGGHVALELEPRYLWGADETVGYLTETCVIGPGAVRLNCDATLAQAALAALKSRPAGDTTWQISWESDGVRQLGGFREVFLRGMFGADVWTVIIVQPEEQALAPVRTLGKVLVPIVVLGLLLAALVGLVQVRRTLGPLKELLQATARVGRYDFDARVPVARNDEFGVLATAFNAMSARLGRQFKALETHADIDAVVLSSVDLSRVADIVLQRMAELVPADRHFLLLGEGVSDGRLRIHTRGRDGLDGRLVAISPADADRLLATGADGGSADGRIEALSCLPAGRLYALPISVRGQLAGALVLGYDAERAPDEEARRLLRDLGDRVAVAVATARRDAELYSRAHFDSLTQLPNRLLGAEELQRAIAAAERQKRTLALLFIDLDGFSAVNDSLGHAAGDQLLKQAAGRLRGCLRRSDMVARFGGDEFAVLLPEVRAAADAAVVGRNIVAALAAPFELDGRDAFVSASVGIALYPDDAATAEALLRHADLAMYSAKEAGRGHVVFFKASMNAEAQRRAELEKDLRHALVRQQFDLYYQPQLDVRAGRVVGAEALIRWNHPERGLVSPLQFIDFAESGGLIDEIGRWALGQAAAQFVAWRRAGLEIDHVSVNVSPRQLRKPGFAGLVSEVLAQAGMPPGAMRLEITETAVMDRLGAAEENLAGLHRLGTPLELDDFGTGYSSLAHLQRLPVDAVKLDHAFLSTIESSASSLAIVRAAIDMAHAVGKRVVAEGVEQPGQLALLSQMGCDLMQGYYISRPLPVPDFAAFMRARTPPLPAER